MLLPARQGYKGASETVMLCVWALRGLVGMAKEPGRKRSLDLQGCGYLSSFHEHGTACPNDPGKNAQFPVFAKTCRV